MAVQELVALVHVVDTPDATGIPGLLVRPTLVLVPRPPVAAWTGRGLEVVLAPNPLEGADRVDRVRVVEVDTFPQGSEVTEATSLLAVLERPSVHRAWDIGDEPALSPEELGDDPWRGLARLDRLPGEEPPQPTVEFLRRLPEVENGRRRLLWDGDGPGERKRRWWEICW